ncbi:hypothetical protein NOR53_1442, partial [gamma proteobacterium NOR5-3]
MIRYLRAALITLAIAVSASSTASDELLDGAAIVALAQEAAGGPRWRDIRSLKLSGTADFFRGGNRDQHSVADSYKMWRVFPSDSADAHAANGQVRFHAQSGDRTLFQISFDGEHSYNQNGRIDDASASEQWKSNFGFGIIRFALRDGFSVLRMADDSVDGHDCFFVQVRDPSDRLTLFAIDQASHAIRMVGFDTPQGFHHRVYDDFQRHAGDRFVQPGSVRLYYDGVKTADIRWMDFEVNPQIPRDTFIINV